MASDIENPFLPFDIIINILTRLPIKSIVKFQCVCKEWKDLIKSQSFISQHTLQTAHQNPFLLIHAYDDNHQRSTLCLLDHNMQTDQVFNTALIDSFRRGWTIVGSSNGLICVELARERWRTPTSYLVWNPVTYEVREVPHFVNDHCDATFGYSSVVDDYKIVRFCQEDIDRGYEIFYGVQVFSLRSGSWKEIKLEGLLNYIDIHHKAAHVNGTIFWYGSGSPFDILIAFDIATEVFTITPIDIFSANVDVQEYGHCPHGVYEYGNKLAMCFLADNIVDDDGKGYNIIMWVIKECGGESGKSYSCTEGYKFGPIFEAYVLQPTFWGNELVCPYIIRNEVEAESDESNFLHMFNLISKEWNKFPNFFDAYDRCAIFNYEKSLPASLQHLG